MDIVITGASGFIGKALLNSLKNRNYSVRSLNREILYGSESKISEAIQNSDVVINLAGATILKRWTKKNKKTIYVSRIETTSNLVNAINSLPIELRPKTFISASAIGIYKSGEIHSESSKNLDSGFLGKLVQDWEDASNNLPAEIHRTIFRLGVVLDKKSQTIKKMMIPFKLGLGATIGSGKQPFPFIHIDDVVSVIIKSVENNINPGIYNLVAPENITNKDFTKAFARLLKRPVFLFIPGILLKLLFGEAAGLLIRSPEVIPKKLLNSDFSFKYPTIEKALTEILVDSD